MVVAQNLPNKNVSCEFTVSVLEGGCQNLPVIQKATLLGSLLLKICKTISANQPL